MRRHVGKSLAQRYTDAGAISSSSSRARRRNIHRMALGCFSGTLSTAGSRSWPHFRWPRPSFPGHPFCPSNPRRQRTAGDTQRRRPRPGRSPETAGRRSGIRSVASARCRSVRQTTGSPMNCSLPSYQPSWESPAGSCSSKRLTSGSPGLGGPASRLYGKPRWPGSRPSDPSQCPSSAVGAYGPAACDPTYGCCRSASHAS